MVKVKEDMTGWVMAEHGVPDSKLTVIKQVEDYISLNGVHHAQWLCECDCHEHKQIVARGSAVKHGEVKSCGCLRRKNNSYDMTTEDFAIGYTQNGEPFWFDKEDIELVKNYCWHYDKYGYVVSIERDTRKKVVLHRLIMGIDNPLIEIDHKTHLVGNAHKIDNRKSNLEIVSHADNMKNQGKYKNNTSGVTGVCWYPNYNQWMAYINVDHNRIHLGYFDEKEDAISARKQAEIKYFGDRRYGANN